MTRCSYPEENNHSVLMERRKDSIIRTCPTCGHHIKCQDQGAGIHELPGLPAGVKFDPTDQEILEHLEAKVRSDIQMLHPLIDEFIPTLEGENGICCTHPEKLPGVSKDGLIRHFFHRPSKAYTTGTRKRRKVHTDSDGSETRWHKTEKTNWVMHQYHLGNNEEEKEGELVVSKVFYQTQPRQCGSLMKDSSSFSDQKLIGDQVVNEVVNHKNSGFVEYYNTSFISFDQGEQHRSNNAQVISHFPVHDGTSFIP
ncbi:unnamed protein product [Vicia faba]|uniref:NAC domain-containing protein n=1 Tax=Vicia faba TaxID=3906 RepID=A0AAV0Z657_VICFA|nr:unnamed protein product [Vicia faba]